MFLLRAVQSYTDFQRKVKKCGLYQNFRYRDLSRKKVNQLSTFPGHSDTKTTYHYVRQQKATERTAELMTDILDV